MAGTAPSRNEWQEGCAPTIITDTSLGYPVLGFQSAVIAFAQCEAAGLIPVRPDGNTSKIREAPTRFLARYAKIRFSPCCVATTLIAVPTDYFVGEGAGGLPADPF